MFHQHPLTSGFLRYVKNKNRKIYKIYKILLDLIIKQFTAIMQKLYPRFRGYKTTKIFKKFIKKLRFQKNKIKIFENFKQ